MFCLQEAGIKIDEDRKEPFSELNYILDCLKQRNLEPALNWAKKHREALLTQVFEKYIFILCYFVVSTQKHVRCTILNVFFSEFFSRVQTA